MPRVKPAHAWRYRTFWWPGGWRGEWVGDACAPQLVRLSLSLPRSFSSMSDITGNGPWGLLGRARLRGGCSAHSRLVLCSALGLHPCPEAPLCPGQAGRLGGLGTPSPDLVPSPIPGWAVPSVPACPPPSSRRLKVTLASPGPALSLVGSLVFLRPQTSGPWAIPLLEGLNPFSWTPGSPSLPLFLSLAPLNLPLPLQGV